MRKWQVVTLSIAGLILILCPVVFFLSTLYVYRSYKLPSEAMTPSLLKGDRFLADLRVKPEQMLRGRIYVYLNPRDPQVTFVKRMVAKGGDRIAIRQSQLFINGEAIPRQELHDLGNPELNDLLTEHVIYQERLDGHTYLTMAAKKVNGSAPDTEFTVPPGEFFFAGDNRTNSWDSRFYGSVRADLIVGRATFITWSLDPDKKFRSERVGLPVN